MTYPGGGAKSLQKRKRQDERLDLGMHLLRKGELRAALDQLKLVYTTAELDDEPELMATCLCEMAWACSKLGELVEGIECAVGAKWLWRRIGNPSELSRALSVEAMLLLDLGLIDQAYELSGQAVDLAQELDDPAILAFALNARGVTLALCRELDLATAVLGEAVCLAEGQGNLTAGAFYTLNLGFAYAKLADEAEKLMREDEATEHGLAAIRHSRQAIAMAAAVDDVWTLRVAHCNCAEMLARTGDTSAAIALLEQCAELPELDGTSLRAHYLYTLAFVCHRAGDLPNAELAARRACDLAENSGQLDHLVNGTEILANILEAGGDLSGALDQHKRFHRLYVQQSGETARRRAHIEEIRSETERLRAHAAELAELAMSDPLTGIANRRSFNAILERLADTPYAVAIVDLDHFKQVNDVFSHAVGDAVLQKVARIMVDHLGAHGHVARLGGEEFAFILPGAPIATAAALCEGVRIAILATDWGDLAPDLTVSVSIGVAAGDGDMLSDSLIQLADERLYEAKTKGRNQVIGQSSLFARQKVVA